MANAGRGKKAGPAWREIDDDLKVLRNHMPAKLVVIPHRCGGATNLHAILTVKVAEATRLRAKIPSCASVNAVVEITFEGRVSAMNGVDLYPAVFEEEWVVLLKTFCKKRNRMNITPMRRKISKGAVLLWWPAICRKGLLLRSVCVSSGCLRFRLPGCCRICET